MSVTPRPELARKNSTVLDLDLLTYDTRRIRALVCHHSSVQPPARVLVHWRLSPSMVNLEGSDPSTAQLHILRDPLLRLEERVLDFLALLSAARQLDFLRGASPAIDLAPGQQVFDEFRIGRALVKRGWCHSIDPERVNIEYR